MRKLKLRLRLALWAFRNPDTLTMLHFEMLRDAEYSQSADMRLLADMYAWKLWRMPGAAENIAAL